MLAKSALKYAGDMYRGRRGKQEAQKIDLEPLHRKLDALAKNQPPRWVHYAMLTSSFLTLLVMLLLLMSAY